MYDIIIKNGTIIDGTGEPMFVGDVGIKEDQIKEIGKLQNESAHTLIDASDYYVTPGFVDVNNHSDTYWRLFLEPGLPSLVYQGITTIIGGNCGSSLAPLINRNIIQTIQKWADINAVNFNWLRMKEFLSEMERRQMAVNFGTLVGHATLRRGLLKDAVRQTSEDEIKVMKHMLRAAMKEGALGLSTGLVYTHAKLASEKELVELARVVKEYDGVYSTHIRGEATELIKAVSEALRVAKDTGVKIHISHLKAIGKQNWSLMDEALNLIETARTSGIDVTFDVYPYTATGSVLYVFLPDWVAEGGKKMMVRRLKDPKMRARVIEEMKKDYFDYSKVIISISPLDKTLTRKKIIEIADAQGKSVEEIIIDVLIASEGRLISIAEVLSEKNVGKAIRHPFSIIASNGSGYSVEHRDSGELVHPRNFGAFPRLLARYVREKQLISWEEAIHKITGRPAQKFGIKRRGIIKKGNFADVVIFDPQKIQDFATVENPYQYSQGIKNVILNGEVILSEGSYNKERKGKVIRRSSSLFNF